MTTIELIGSITLILSILTKIIGFPSQAKLLMKSKKTENISISLYSLTFLAYISWTIHGILKNDYTIIFGQGLGILTSGFVLGQIIYYRRNEKKSSI